MTLFLRRLHNSLRALNHTRATLQLNSKFTQSTESPEEEMDELKKNPYFEKYSSKITKLQSDSGEEFNQKLEDLKDSHKPKSYPEPNERKNVQQAAKPNLKGQYESMMNKAKKLEDVMKLELIENKSPEEIAEIWKEYHKKENQISGIIDKTKYEFIIEKSKKFNTFLLPLPRDQGYEFIVCQFQNNECHFTTLLNFQTYKENAPECLTLIHFDELAENKGIVLMKGEFHSDAINALEAQCLINQLQLFYGTDDPEKTKLLETFTYSPEKFKHNDLIVEIQKSLVMK